MSKISLDHWKSLVNDIHSKKSVEPFKYQASHLVHPNTPVIIHQ